MTNPWQRRPNQDLGDKPNKDYNQQKDSVGNGDFFNFLSNGLLPQNTSNDMIVKIVLSIIGIVWILSGIYIVNPEEDALVMRFGKYIRTESPGMHYHLPSPIEFVNKEVTTRVHVIKIGDEDADISVKKHLAAKYVAVSSDLQPRQTSLMLTGDENMIDIQFEVQWKISNLKDYIFNIKNPVGTIIDVSQSVVREIIAKSVLAMILTKGRSEIESTAKEQLQAILNSYGAGVEIVLVQMLRADPPQNVIDAFRDVQTARVDKESEINRAETYANDIIPKARGKCQEILNAAESAAIEITSKAIGTTKQFNAIYEQYRHAPYVTRKRMYIETMEEILSKIDKIIVDPSLKNIVLPLNRSISSEALLLAQANNKVGGNVVASDNKSSSD